MTPLRLEWIDFFDTEKERYKKYRDLWNATIVGTKSGRKTKTSIEKIKTNYWRLNHTYDLYNDIHTWLYNYQSWKANSFRPIRIHDVDLITMIKKRMKWTNDKRKFDHYRLAVRQWDKVICPLLKSGVQKENVDYSGYIYY